LYNPRFTRPQLSQLKRALMLAGGWQKYGAIVIYEVQVSASVCHGVSFAVASVLNNAAVRDWLLVYVFKSGHHSLLICPSILKA
jgi:hypothetical protein